MQGPVARIIFREMSPRLLLIKKSHRGRRRLRWQLHIFINRLMVHRHIILCNYLCQVLPSNPSLAQTCPSELFQTERNDLKHVGVMGFKSPPPL